MMKFFQMMKSPSINVKSPMSILESLEKMYILKNNNEIIIKLLGTYNIIYNLFFYPQNCKLH